MGDFAEETKDMSSVEILNYYRNLYYREPNTTEQGIVAWAINDILPKYVNEQEMKVKAIDEFAERLKSDEFQKYNLDMVFETSRDLSYSQCIDAFHEYINEIAQQMKKGINNE